MSFKLDSDEPFAVIAVGGGKAVSDERWAPRVFTR
jgi:hypothetical protein